MWLALLFALVWTADGLTSASGTAGADVTDRQTRTVSLADGRALLVDITIGSIRIEGWNRPDAEIVLDRRVPTAADQKRLPLEIDEAPSRVSVRAVQADGLDPALRVDATIRVPRAALIERVQVMEGRVILAAFHGSVTADVRRGPIEATDVSGTLRLETGIGSIALTGARLSPNGLLRLRTFNGNVRLTLAERPADARLLALALNGTIRSDIPLTTKDSWGPRWGEASIGKGEPVISIDVVNGAIDIKAPR